VASPHPSARTLLVLGRASNLPTVWSNCFAGWLLGGGGSGRALAQLCVGGSLLYLGGMYLNDAFDAAFDRQYRRERPIPSGAIEERLVWQLGFGLLGVGWLLLALLGWSSALLATLLVVAVLVYDAVHKAVAFSPVLMAACRFLLLLVAASASRGGVAGESIWNALALAGWIVGLSYVAKRESTSGQFRRWPLAPLALPLLFAALYNFRADSQGRALVLAVALVAWAGWCLRHTVFTGSRNLGLTVGGLLAGICLVDALAVVPSGAGCAVFGGLFVASLLGQRFVPAT
jgi:4-hydroxybenzoate polyprenyltransferase